MNYNGGLTSNNIVKRSFAVFGHFFLAYVIILLAVGIIAGIISLFV